MILSKDSCTSPKEIKEWTEVDEAELTKLMRKIVRIEEQELAIVRIEEQELAAVQRKIAAGEDELRLVAMSKKLRILTG